MSGTSIPTPGESSSIDSELFARVAQGDRQAETDFVRRHQRAVSLVLQSRVEPDRVHDLVQETFIVVIQRMRDSGVHDPNRIGAFLRQTAINLANNERRKQIRQRTDTDNDSLEVVVDEALGPSDLMELSDLTSAVGSLMDEIPMLRDRDLLHRYLVNEEDKLTLCQEFGITSEHFDRILHRARLRLKDLLDMRRGSH